jgi:Glycosyltransferase family 87
LDFLRKISVRVGVLCFCIAALYFMARGPWRAVGSVNSYDFAAVYGAARCWLRGENPYDMPVVVRTLREAGDDPATLPNTDPPPSVYLPTALPLMSSVAWLPWKAARLTWSLLSIAVFLVSAVLILRACTLTTGQKWLLGAGLLLFSPTSSGLSTGNPSVVSCALTLAAVFLTLGGRFAASALLLGLAHSIKPQVSIAAVALFLLWGYWRVVGLSFLVPLFAGIVSFIRAGSFGEYRLWLISLQKGIADLTAPGGMNDPSPANYFSYHLINTGAILSIWLRDGRIVATVVWITAGVLVGAYFWFRSRTRGEQQLRDVAFFCALALVLVYHRYYDAQLLLGVVPFLLASGGRLDRTKAAIWAVLLLLTFPLQAVVAESIHQLSPTTPVGFLLLRHQPVILLLLCLLLIPWSKGLKHSEGGHTRFSDATVCNS